MRYSKFLTLIDADVVQFETLLAQSGIRSQCDSQPKADLEFLRLLMRQYAAQVIAYCEIFDQKRCTPEDLGDFRESLRETARQQKAGRTQQIQQP